MTAWTQTHPTRPVTAPDGETVNIDQEMVPLVTQLWRLGFDTLLACQDLGEAILGGGTRTPPADREDRAATCMGRAWLKVRSDEADRLLGLLHPLSTDEWVLHSPEPPRTQVWVSVTFPRRDIEAAAQLLSALGTTENRR